MRLILLLQTSNSFSGKSNKWYESFPKDYFHLILVDEGHHNVAETWTRIFDYFSEAKVVSFTATPMRSDGKVVSGERVYKFGYKRSMLMGFISQIDALFVQPKEVTFNSEGETKTISLDGGNENEGKRLV